MHVDYYSLESRIKSLENGRCCNKKSKTLSSDGYVRIGSNTVVDLIIVQSEGNLAAFTVGTTDGGDEVLTAMAVVADTWTPFVVMAYSSVAYNLYFGGITSSTQILIYTR